MPYNFQNPCAASGSTIQSNNATANEGPKGNRSPLPNACQINPEIIPKMPEKNKNGTKLAASPNQIPATAKNLTSPMPSPSLFRKYIKPYFSPNPMAAPASAEENISVAGMSFTTPYKIPNSASAI